MYLLIFLLSLLAYGLSELPYKVKQGQKDRERREAARQGGKYYYIGADGFSYRTRDGARLIELYDEKQHLWLCEVRTHARCYDLTEEEKRRVQSRYAEIDKTRREEAERKGEAYCSQYFYEPGRVYKVELSTGRRFEFVPRTGKFKGGGYEIHYYKDDVEVYPTGEFVELTKEQYDILRGSKHAK